MTGVLTRPGCLVKLSLTEVTANGRPIQSINVQVESPFKSTNEISKLFLGPS